MRKDPPVVCSCHSRMPSSDPFENSRRALAAADAHGDHAVARVAPLHFAEDGRGQFRAGAAERMAQRDGAAVDVDDFRIESGGADHGQRLRRESFVEFDDADVVQLEPGERQRFGNRHHGTDAHDFRRHARRGETDEARLRASAPARAPSCPT